MLRVVTGTKCFNLILENAGKIVLDDTAAYVLCGADTIIPALFCRWNCCIAGDYDRYMDMHI